MAAKRIIRYAAWDRPTSLEAVIHLFSRAVAIDAGYEVLHKTPQGAAVIPRMMNHPVVKYIKITFEEEEAQS